MSTEDLKKEIIDSLVQHLPNLANYLNKLVMYMQDIINGRIPKDINTIETIITELELILGSLIALRSAVPVKNIDPKNKILFLYKDATNNTLIGLKTLLGWIKNTDEPEETLRKSIDLLFTSGQQITELVNIITE